MCSNTESFNTSEIHCLFILDLMYILGTEFIPSQAAYSEVSRHKVVNKWRSGTAMCPTVPAVRQCPEPKRNLLRYHRTDHVIDCSATYVFIFPGLYHSRIVCLAVLGWHLGVSLHETASNSAIAYILQVISS